jgi:3-deoxy-7-phosphoheptulonate synthase
MVDFSHGNSRKDFKRQMEVSADVAAQLAAGEDRIFGVMIESHLNEGRQDPHPDQPLAYGVAITDACLGWDDTVAVLDQLAEAVKKRRLALAAR